MKLEDVLKKQGFSDADIAAAGPLLGDAKFRGAVETFVGGMESQLTAFRVENDNWANWAEQTNKPQLDTLGREKLDLTGKVGSLEARLQALDPTYKPGEPQQRGAQPPAGGSPTGDFDPAKYGLMTRAQFDEEVLKYAAGQGSAIALANDLAMEYRRLTGSDMLDYQTTDSDGRPMAGMSALLYEARRDKKPLPDYIATKFDFAGKRAAAREASQKAHEESIRKDERTKVVAEFGNPNTRPGMPSAQPFIPPRANNEGAAKMPWEVPAAERRNRRISNALETQAKSMVQ